jgi:putative Holliday junction resolvase
MGRIMAIDVGKARTGLAVTDELRIIANGLCTVETKKLIDYIKTYTTKEKVDFFVVGLPKQMNAQDSQSMVYVKQVVANLNKTFPDIEVKMFDERFTSVLAHQAMLNGGLKKKERQNKALVDQISATIILQGYMESLDYK